MSTLSNLCCCIYCHEEKSSMGIHTHVDRTHLKLTKYSNGNNGKYKQISKKAKEKRQSKINEYLKTPSLCSTCNIKLEYDKRNNKFCSQICSAIYTNESRNENGWKHSNYSKDKIKTALIKYNKENGNYIKNIKKCKECNNNFEAKKKKHVFCSKKCAGRHRSKLLQKDMDCFKKYKLDSSFNFNLKDYPNEFNFNLIETYGWYSAKNRGNNLRGISRDHMISVRFGFDNEIPPGIIKHPANCELMQHIKNSSKNCKCSITIDVLIDKIKQWDRKYNKQLCMRRPGDNRFAVNED